MTDGEMLSRACAAAASDKKAENIAILDLRGISALLPTVCTRVPSIALKSTWLPCAPSWVGADVRTPSSICHGEPS